MRPVRRPELTWLGRTLEAWRNELLALRLQKPCPTRLTLLISALVAPVGPLLTPALPMGSSRAFMRGERAHHSVPPKKEPGRPAVADRVMMR